jgi:putative oxidoreductase
VQPCCLPSRGGLKSDRSEVGHEAELLKRRFAVNAKINSYDLVIARSFLALIFVVEGISKISAADATRHYMQAKHLPGGLLWPVILFEIGSGLLTAVGYQTRVVAPALTVYCLLTAAIFHTSLSDQVQNLMLLKNIAMAGGFMLLSYVGAGRTSIDGRLATPSLRVISRRTFHSS